jgi:hypothetical protein
VEVGEDEASLDEKVLPLVRRTEFVEALKR